MSRWLVVLTDLVNLEQYPKPLKVKEGMRVMGPPPVTTNKFVRTQIQPAHVLRWPGGSEQTAVVRFDAESSEGSTRESNREDQGNTRAPGCLVDAGGVRGRQAGQTSKGSGSAVSKPSFAAKCSLEIS